MVTPTNRIDNLYAPYTEKLRLHHEQVKLIADNIASIKNVSEVTEQLLNISSELSNLLELTEYTTDEVLNNLISSMSEMLVFATKDLLNVSLIHPNGTQARVYKDSVPTNNTVYVINDGIWSEDSNFISAQVKFIEDKFGLNRTDIAGKYPIVREDGSGFDFAEAVEYGANSAVFSASLVKKLYEENPNTNVLTDSIIEDLIILNASTTSGIKGFKTLADLNADLNHDENSLGLVVLDPDIDNNGTYIKNGASGSGDWVISSYDRLINLRKEITDYIVDLNQLPVDPSQYKGAIRTFRSGLLQVNNNNVSLDEHGDYTFNGVSRLYFNTVPIDFTPGKKALISFKFYDGAEPDTISVSFNGVGVQELKKMGGFIYWEGTIPSNTTGLTVNITTKVYTKMYPMSLVYSEDDLSSFKEFTKSIPVSKTNMFDGTYSLITKAGAGGNPTNNNDGSFVVAADTIVTARIPFDIATGTELSYLVKVSDPRAHAVAMYNQGQTVPGDAESIPLVSLGDGWWGRTHTVTKGTGNNVNKLTELRVIADNRYSNVHTLEDYTVEAVYVFTGKIPSSLTNQLSNQVSNTFSDTSPIYIHKIDESIKIYTLNANKKEWMRFGLSMKTDQAANYSGFSLDNVDVGSFDGETFQLNHVLFSLSEALTAIQTQDAVDTANPVFNDLFIGGGITHDDEYLVDLDILVDGSVYTLNTLPDGFTEANEVEILVNEIATKESDQSDAIEMLQNMKFTHGGMVFSLSEHSLTTNHVLINYMSMCPIVTSAFDTIYVNSKAFLKDTFVPYNVGGLTNPKVQFVGDAGRTVFECLNSSHPVSVALTDRRNTGGFIKGYFNVETGTMALNDKAYIKTLYTHYT